MPKAKTKTIKSTKKSAKKSETKAVVLRQSSGQAKKEISAQAYDAIISPRITEKGAISAEVDAYIFNVKPDATKAHIAKSIEALYKVIPRKVTVVKYPGKRVFAKGKWGKTAGGKKAYVFLKKGEQIQVM